MRTWLFGKEWADLVDLLAILLWHKHLCGLELRDATVKVKELGGAVGDSIIL